MNKKIFCRVMGLVLAFAILLGGFSVLTFVTNQKKAYEQWPDFFEEAESLDVIFLGNSRMRDAVLPTEIWAEYGITGYNMSFPGATSFGCYCMLMNTLDYVSPKAVILDCSLLSWTDTDISKAQLQSYLVRFPMSLTKLRTAFEMYPLGEASVDDLFSVIWSFSIFHNRWSELELEDFYVQNVSDRGGVKLFSNTICGEPFFTYEALAYEETAAATEYIVKIAEECEKRGIELLLCHLPFSAGEQEAKAANTGALIAEGLGLEYINFLSEDIIDYKTDMYEGDHMNFSGAMKISSFLGRHLSETYGLPDHREEAGYSCWDDSYPGYIADKYAVLANEPLLDNYLLKLSDRQFSSVISILPGSDLFEQEKLVYLLKNVAGTTLPLFDQAAESGEGYMFFVDSKSGTVYEALGNGLIEDSSVGQIGASYENAFVLFNGQEYGLANPCKEAEHSDIQVFVFDSGLEPLTECSHSFAFTEDGYFERTDY